MWCAAPGDPSRRLYCRGRDAIAVQISLMVTDVTRRDAQEVPNGDGVTATAAGDPDQPASSAVMTPARRPARRSMAFLHFCEETLPGVSLAARPIHRISPRSCCFHRSGTLAMCIWGTFLTKLWTRAAVCATRLQTAAYRACCCGSGRPDWAPVRRPLRSVSPLNGTVCHIVA